MNMMMGISALKVKPSFSAKPKVAARVKSGTRKGGADYEKHRDGQESKIVYMVKNGCSDAEIEEETQVSRSFIYKCKCEHGLINSTVRDRRNEIKRVIKASAPLTYSPASLAKKMGVKVHSIYDDISKMDEIKKGVRRGCKNKLWYDHSFDWDS